MKPTPPNEYRVRDCIHRQFNTTDADGMNGAFEVPLHKLANLGHKVIANCIVSDGTNEDGTPFVTWEHVSVHINEFGKARTPTWAEMCLIKDLFWSEDEVVVQYHPAKKDYVNVHPHVLHLWKDKRDGFPTPPKICV